ncbi:carbamoyltransferase HypF [Adlercreutzia sp. ZJ304]|uniref:carbamoyltransferase HypF n=1 Tax=Adlercreutzia sp. ZJ304 TaxID=2709791 RepID=UPI0013EADF5D|nr:carbamoyltransferase HypF [Adlercreutzia sp. ZJ304]
MLSALDIWVKGIVQGVGFRPFVYRLAKRYLVNGWVLNSADGVHIHAEGEEKLVDEFVLAISDSAPAAAQITEIEMHEVPIEGYNSFEIRTSDASAEGERTLVSPDLATCADCERELFDPEDRRFRYPFINCTNCGPRFTIIDSLPYDRASTSMREFKMCDECAAEYANPVDRRFHAQPDACFDCGPCVSWYVPLSDSGDAEGLRSEVAQPSLHSFGSDNPEVLRSEASQPSLRPSGSSDAVFAAAVDMLCDGKILAVKGLGGFHLVCDANNAQAVAELRRRKRRPAKAFAVMCSRLDDVRAICQVNDSERKLLEGSQRPIVLLRKLPGIKTPKGIADGLPELGVMLPYTPVQHILLNDFCAAYSRLRAKGAQRSGQGTSVPMLVMTSGNLHDEPIVINDEEAYEKLAGIADAFLGNNREILSRFDDSVVRVINTGDSDAIQFVRRARGFAPMPISLPPSQASREDDSVIFATGPEQKNTFTFVRGADAFVSQHIGDVENAETFDAWLQAKARYEKLFDLAATALACDMHPEYITSKWAHEQSEKCDLPLTLVQHHHAHIVAAMAENGLSDAVCGIAFDGTGYGPDGAIWGGEVLLSNLSAFERFANFAYVPMPGGQACVKHPLRMAYGILWEFDLLEHPGAQFALQALGAEQAKVCETMIENGLNTPYTSSVGRLFDAVSALLGICTEPTYEGEPAIMLEAAINFTTSENSDNAAYEIAVVKNTATAQSTAQDTSVVLLDAEPAIRALLDDFAAGVAVSIIARRFHDAIVDAVVTVAQLVAATYDIQTVVLSGGVFMNRYLIEHSLAAIQREGFTVAINRDLPPNDGCISLGQAIVASKS